MANTILSSGVRNNLLTLQQTTAQQGVIQNRLATGKKVNSAIDNPVNFFTSLNLNDRGDQLKGLLDGISNGIQTIKLASQGIDGITKLVQSLQSTGRQAQSEAANNRPKIAGTVDLATNSTTLPVNAGKRDIALNKVLVGAAAVPAAADDPAVAGDSSTPGSVGIAAAAALSTNAFQIKAGSTTYTFNFSATSTVRDLVNSINGSGIATATVGDDGRLSITGTGSDALTVASGSTVDATGVFSADAQLPDLVGAVTTTGVISSGSSSVRSTLVKQFNDLRDQIDKLAKDSGYNGINLLGGDKLSIIFNEKTGANKNQLDVQGDTVTSDNLGISTALDGLAGVGQFNIQNDNDLNKAADALTNVLTSLRATSSSLGSNLAVVQTRQDFTNNMISTLRTGADNLVSADSNEEGASLLALNTRQQLSQTALSLANQADQGVLRLFG